MELKLDNELSSILREMVRVRDSYLERGYTWDNALCRCYDLYYRRLKKIITDEIFSGTELFKGKRLSLHSFRHSNAIRRIDHISIHDLMREFGHTSPNTTVKKYLNFQDQRKQIDFPFHCKSIKPRLDETLKNRRVISPFSGAIL